MLKSEKFATAINCMDGRVQMPVIQWLKENYQIDYVDMVTEPGPDKILAENKEKTVVESIKKRVEISLTKHHSNIIAIVGHYDCAGNPVDKETHIQQIKSAIRTIRTFGFNAKLVGLWVNEEWKIEEVLSS